MTVISVTPRSVGRIVDKKFVSTCHFQLKQIPVRYVEKVELQLNSTKKRYTKHVLYENTLVPTRWTETMVMRLQDPSDGIVTEVVMPCDDQYIPLVPKQDTAKEINNNQGRPPTTTNVPKHSSKNMLEEFMNEMRKMQ